MVPHKTVKMHVGEENVTFVEPKLVGFILQTFLTLNALVVGIMFVIIHTGNTAVTSTLLLLD